MEGPYCIIAERTFLFNKEALISGELDKALENDAAKEYVSILTPELSDSLWREQLQRGGSVSFCVASNSMLPTLSRGDHIIVKRIPATGQPRLGDIILFYTGGRWVVHRIVGRKKTDGKIFYRQKGDAEFRATETPASAVAGRVVMVERGSEFIDLDVPWRRAINRSFGMINYAMDQVLRICGDIGKGRGEKVGQASAWRVKAAGCLRLTRAVLASIAARVMRLGARR